MVMNRRLSRTARPNASAFGAVAQRNDILSSMMERVEALSAMENEMENGK